MPSNKFNKKLTSFNIFDHQNIRLYQLNIKMGFSASADRVPPLVIAVAQATLRRR